MGHPPPNHDIERVMASLHPRNVFLHLTGCLSINLLVLAVVLLLVLAVVLLLEGEDFLTCKEDVFVPILGLTLEEPLCSCPSNHLQNGSKDVSL